jgi:Carbohydrate-selective porin, OprB family
MTIDSKCLLFNTFSLLLIASHVCANPAHEQNNSLDQLKISKNINNTNELLIQNDLPYGSSKLKAELNTTERRQASSINANPDRVPSVWALTTLQFMAKRYNCNTANINNLSGSNDSMTRDEFAADLNTCVQQVMKIKNSRMANLVPKKDLLNLQKLEKEFAIELTKLTTPVATLQADTESTTKQELYPTTKFGGEVIFANSFGLGGGPKNTPNTNLTFSHLTRLGLETSFTGKDTLRTYLTTGNSAPGGYANPASFDTNMARLSSQASLDNKIRLDLLEYRIPAFNDKTVIS